MISTASTGSVGELHEQAAEARAELHVGHELVGVVAGGGRDVDGAARQASGERGDDLVGDRLGGAAAGVGGACLGGRRQQQARRGEHGGRERLAGRDGHGGAGQAAVAQRLRQRLEVHGARRARADQPGAGLELRQLGGAEEPHAGGRLCDEHVGLRQDLLRRDALDQAGGHFSGRLRLAREHLHAERARPLHEQARARAHAHQPERLAADLGAVARPQAGVAAPQRGVGAGQVAGDRQHERQRVLGLRDERAVRRVHHQDAAPRGLRDVDRRGVLAGAADHAESAPLGEHARRDRSARRDDQALGPSDPAQDLVRVPASAALYLEPCIDEPVHALRGEIVEDDHSLLLAHLTASRGGGPAHSGPGGHDCVQG